jgi:hypothetical protein
LQHEFSPKEIQDLIEEVNFHKPETWSERMGIIVEFITSFVFSYVLFAIIVGINLSLIKDPFGTPGEAINVHQN